MYIEYPSSQDHLLRLFADFVEPPDPRPIRLQMHGWHGQVRPAHPDNVTESADSGWFNVRPEMRGRGDATGAPDCNGWEIQDAVDAVAFARERFADKVAEPNLITLSGGSGGGGNVFAMLGRFPDFFCRALVQCGISDYALWYRNDEQGEFRDEMDVWIGADPDAGPEAYAARSGVTTVANLLAPLIIFHGETDIRVPSEHARRFVAAAEAAGKGGLVAYHEIEGVGTRNHFGNITPEQQEFMRVEGRAFLTRDRRPIEIPERGRFVVAGYLKTRCFEIVLDSIDHVALLEYDLTAADFRLTAPTAKEARLRVHRDDGSWQEWSLDCQPCASWEECVAGA